MKALLQRGMDRTETKFNVAGPGTVATLAHETGHYLMPFIKTRAHQLYGDANNLMHDLESNTSNGSFKAVSMYGGKNFSESFAEAFSAYSLGVKPTMGKPYYAMFRQIMRDVGLSSLEGVLDI